MAAYKPHTEPTVYKVEGTISNHDASITAIKAYLANDWGDTTGNHIAEGTCSNGKFTIYLPFLMF